MKLLRPDQAADQLNVNVRTVYRLVKDGDIAAVKIRSILRIPDYAVEKYISKQLQIYSYEHTGVKSPDYNDTA